MKENILKSVLAAILAAAAVYFRELLAPVIVLLIVMLIDYITGMTAAWTGGTLSSRAGIVGIIKKIGYLFAVAVAVVVDYVIQSAAVSAGLDLAGFYACGMLVTVWLILNECISILENLGEIGVPLPAFLMAIVKRLRQTAEKEGEKHAPEPVPDSDTEAKEQAGEPPDELDGT